MLANAIVKGTHSTQHQLVSLADPGFADVLPWGKFASEQGIVQEPLEGHVEGLDLQRASGLIIQV